MYLAYGKAIAQKVVEHHMANGGVSRFEKFRIYHESFLGIKLTSEEIESMSKKFSDLVLSKVVACPYIPGVVDFIRKSQSTYTHFVISGTPHDEMNEIIQRRNIARYFQGIMGSPKTKSQWIKELTKKKMIEVESCVFIGDATTDYNAAKDTGTKFILREVDYNKELFLDYSGVRVQDFKSFEKIIEAL